MLMIQRGEVRLFAFLLVFACFFLPALAQVSTSTITGRVTDPTGSVIPGVSITVVNTETNFSFTTQSNPDGLYRVPSLSPGNYRVTFRTPGFKVLVRDTDVRISETLPVNATLEIGEVTQSIEVSGRPQLLETETSATGSVVDGKQFYDLPIYQRWTASSFQLVPGMQQSGGAWGGSLGGYHIAGSRSSTIGFFEDGVIAQDQTGGSNNINPVLNSIQEIKVITTTPPAEYGHSSGGAISVVKKSGTNQLHGIASFFGRSRMMQHRRYFDKCRTSQDDPAQGCREQGVMFLQPDINLSGPVYIPGIYDGRNKTFFFAGWQRLIEKKANQGTTTVPTAAMMNGDLTFNGDYNQIYDPYSTRQLADGTWTRDPIPGNIIPESMIDPAARNFINLRPWQPENQPGDFNSTGPISNLLYDQRSNVFFDDWSFRVDHQFTQNFKINWNYTFNDRRDLPRPTRVVNPLFDESAGAYNPQRMDNMSFGNTWVINPTMVNDARFGYYRFHRRREVFAFQQDLASLVGIPNVSGELMPGLGQYGAGGISGPSDRLGETFSFRDDLSIIRGTHAFKMGYELLNNVLDYTQTNRPSGNFNFGNTTAGLQPNGQPVPNTGVGFAAFLLGSVQSASFDRELARWQPRNSIHSFYFQDDWKATPNLTFNLGVRYSNESPFHTANGAQTNWDPTAIDPLTGLQGAFIHPSGNLYRRDNNNFQPRVGMAYHFADKWVFRGGFAVNTIDIKYPSEREHLEEYIAQANLSQDVGDPRPLFRLSQGPPSFEYNILPDGTSPFLGTQYSGRGAQWVDPNLKNAYNMNWNSSLQFEFATDMLLELSYQGSSGVSLLERWEFNTIPTSYGAGDLDFQNQVLGQFQNYRPYPNFGGVGIRSNFGHSTYHGGTVKVEKRMSSGIHFSTFYTFAKNINSQDSDNSGSGVAPLENRGLEKARAGWDRNHRFNFTATYQLPFGRGRAFLNNSYITDLLLGGWEVSGIQTIESGPPLNFSFSSSPYNYYPTSVGARRPDLIALPEIRDGWRDMGPDRFNTAGRYSVFADDMTSYFAYPAPFTPGTAGRNIVTGVPLVWTTVSAQKNFQIHERLNAQLRWDMNNPFKTFSFSQPNRTFNTRNPQNFGKIGSDTTTASWGGQPLMNLTLAFMW